MAWLANPFAYIAINTLLAVMPGVAKKLGLSTMLAGFCCSLWCFARVGAFFGLWHWSGWHYRFRWLLGAYLALISSFVLMIKAPGLTVLLLSQIAFGCALGLIYYSSLFYSMDLSRAKSEHGGIHEAAIGLGNFAGPAVGAVSLHFLPENSSSGVMAVSVLLLVGLASLVAVWWDGK
jgi:predicted MFS family arabinose efflux permease